MKTKKISQKKSAVTMWQNIYVSNKHVLDYDVNVIFADLNEVLNDGTTYISKCCVLFLIIILTVILPVWQYLTWIADSD